MIDCEKKVLIRLKTRHIDLRCLVGRVFQIYHIIYVEFCYLNG